MLQQSAEKLQNLIKEEEEMNRQRLEHCERCHAAIESATITYDKDRPVVIYLPPNNCNVCKEDHYDITPTSRLPKPEDSLLCRCAYPGCEKEFYCRPSWYKRQQSIVKSKGNIWMPVLIDSDAEKVERLLNSPEESESEDQELISK